MGSTNATCGDAAGAPGVVVVVVVAMDRLAVLAALLLAMLMRDAEGEEEAVLGAWCLMS